MDDTRGDLVTPDWLRLHGIVIPRAEGVFESESAWVKTDAQGRVVAASEKDRSVLAYLVAQGDLNELHRYYALVFVDLWNAFLRKTQHYANPVYAAEFFGADPGDSSFGGLYLKVCRKLGRGHEKTVKRGLQPVSPATAGLNVTTYRMAFDALARAVNEARVDAEEGR